MCVASPNASAAAGDATTAAFQRKLRRYRREIRELRAAGIVYRPLVWTAAGRSHPAVARTLRLAASQAAVNSGQQTDANSMMRRWRHEIQVAIQRRRAAMARAVLPKPGALADWIVTGQAPGVPCCGGREHPLQEDD